MGESSIAKKVVVVHQNSRRKEFNDNTRENYELKSPAADMQKLNLTQNSFYNNRNTTGTFASSNGRVPQTAQQLTDRTRNSPRFEATSIQSNKIDNNGKARWSVISPQQPMTFGRKAASTVREPIQ